MAQYTIELNRLIKAGYQIFDDSWTTFDPAHKQELCDKIIRHYWFYEIGSETPDRFRHYLNEHLARIMPYYNQLYQSELLKLEPLYSYVLETSAKTNADKQRIRSMANAKNRMSTREMADSIRRLMEGTQNLTGTAGTTTTDTWTEDRDKTGKLTHDETTTDSLDHKEQGTQNTTGSDESKETTTTDMSETMQDTSSGTKDSKTTNVTSGNSDQRYSDTPQAQITETGMTIEQSYLTNYTRNTDNQNVTGTLNDTIQNTDNRTTDTDGTVTKEGSKTVGEYRTTSTDFTDTGDGTRNYTEDDTSHEDISGSRNIQVKQNRGEDISRNENQSQFQNGTATEQGEEQEYTAEDETYRDTGVSERVARGYTESQAKLLLEYRKTFLNIDAQIIADLENNFMGVF